MSDEYECSTPGRDKNWDELSVEQKLERMRNVVKTNNRFARNMGRKVEGLREHIHDSNGRMFVPLKSNIGNFDSSDRNEDRF